MMDTLKKLVEEGKNEQTVQRVKELLAGGQEPEAILQQGLIAAMDSVGERFQKGEYYLPEMLIAARAMKQGLEELRPKLTTGGGTLSGKVVMGTVQGDLHDIGKNLVSMAMEGAGFEVVDLGVDIAPAGFVKAVQEHQPIALGLSALLTTTMTGMRDTIEAISKAGLRDNVRILVGGAPLTSEYAEQIGADFYGAEPVAGKEYVKSLVTS
jgi:5-methyltetrahydrofolate--homocysteine methyltransferase